MNDRRIPRDRTHDRTSGARGADWTTRLEVARDHGDAAGSLVDAIEWAAGAICERWKPAILWLLARGPLRYNDLQRRLTGVTPKMLAEQLADLARDGLVVRTEHAGGAKHVEYALTPIGEALGPVTEAFAVWARQYADRRRHDGPAESRGGTARERTERHPSG